MVPWSHVRHHATFRGTLAPSWGSGFGSISGPFWRRFRTHFWSLLEAVSALILELIWSVEVTYPGTYQGRARRDLRRSVSQPGKLPLHAPQVDVWTLPGPSGPTLLARHFRTHFGSLLEDRFGTHFWSILEAVSGLILELIWSA